MTQQTSLLPDEPPLKEKAKEDVKTSAEISSARGANGANKPKADPAAPTSAPPSVKKEATEADNSPKEKPPVAYLVLARKYRPIGFSELIGQDAMVQTLRQAFLQQRIPHAIILTGMRGVGKTTTARIIARAMNYPNTDKPTTEMEVMTDSCRDILESRHPDVIEMDAASRTGIADIRDIIDSVSYRPVMARKKIYIIDEVHMLSTAAFNGLLKTLEEPPDHVMFIFATTEIRKVPITVLSRCQRFDLRRLTLEETRSLLESVLAKEKYRAEEGALLLLARAAEGSARDALSLLDQAIARCESRNQPIAEENIQLMLGLAGRHAILNLFDHIASGEPQKALEDLQQRYDHGADPLWILSDCADFTHFLTRVKLMGKSGEDYRFTSNDRARARQMAEQLSFEKLTLIWQMLLKGLAEARIAPDPYQAAEMILIRIAYAQTLPSLSTLTMLVQKGEEIGEEEKKNNEDKKSRENGENGEGDEETMVQNILDRFPGSHIVNQKK